MKHDIPKGFTQINEGDLSLIIRQIIEAYVRTDTKKIDLYQWELKHKIYDLVIYELKRTKRYYKGLSKEKIEKFFNKFIINKVPENKKYKDIYEEYDDLVWKKLNNLDYDKDRLLIIKQKINV